MVTANNRACASRYVIEGDGCNMEGISNEAASLAGHWGLGKLIVFYDDNRISIDGNTDISFTEDVSARYEALGWHVQHVVVRRGTVALCHVIACDGIMRSASPLASVTKCS